MRTLSLATALALAMPAIVSAQSQTPATGVPPAPVGHRQPTAADVPAGDSARSGPVGADPAGAPTRSPADKKIDKLINVCPSC